MSQQANRIQAARQAAADPRTTVELRDADVGNPDISWRKSALAYVATAVVATAASAVMVKNVQAAPAPAPAPTQQAAQPLIVIVDGKPIETLQPMDRVRLCKIVAAEKNLKASGLDWRDLYAIVHAETGWAPRDGMGRNGKVSRGLAQLEDSTAKTLGVDPHNPKQAVGAVADLLKEAADWSRAKGYSAGSGSMSVYYNLSTRGRNAWDGRSKDAMESLPIETQRHISNVSQGKLVANSLERAWTLEQRQQLRHAAAYVPRRVASDGSNETQRMKGLIATTLQPQQPANTASEREQMRQVEQDVGRSGVRMATEGIDRVRTDVMELIERIKQGVGARLTHGATKPALDGRQAALSERPTHAVVPAVDGVKPASMTTGNKKQEIMLSDAIINTVKLAGSSIEELRRVAARNPMFSGYLEQMTQFQLEQEQKRNAMRHRGG